MENQHRKISGYRELTQDEIDSMNAIKSWEQDAMRLIDRMGKLPGVDQRRLSLAKTNIEQGCMWAVKAIARPNEA